MGVLRVTRGHLDDDPVEELDALVLEGAEARELLKFGALEAPLLLAREEDRIEHRIQSYHDLTPRRMPPRHRATSARRRRLQKCASS